jgi:hypothetical protein
MAILGVSSVRSKAPVNLLQERAGIDKLVAAVEVDRNDWLKQVSIYHVFLISLKIPCRTEPEEAQRTSVPC